MAWIINTLITSQRSRALSFNHLNPAFYQEPYRLTWHEKVTVDILGALLKARTISIASQLGHMAHRGLHARYPQEGLMGSESEAVTGEN